jgi:5-hydroxyisourate hydrolase-like protein (transthyretin family)
VSWRKRILLVLLAALLAALGSAPWWLRPEPADPSLETRLEEPEEPAFNVRPRRETFGSYPIRVLDAEGQPAAEVVVDLESAQEEEVGHSTDAQGWVQDYGRDYGYPLTATVRWYRSAPQTGVLEGPEDELVFRFLERCPVLVRVEDVQGEPVAAALEFDNGDEAWSAATDASGEVLVDMACSFTNVEAYVEGWATRRDYLHAGRQDRLVVRLRAGQRVFGRVLLPDGEPVEGVRVAAMGQDRGYSEEDGRYEVWVQRSGAHVLQIDDGDFEPDHQLVVLPDEALEVEHDVVVQPIHLVEVRCEGLEDDPTCAWVPLIQCTSPGLPVGTLCQERGGRVTCRCPLGEAAVRGGGQAVLIGAEDDIAWLDFRDEGGLSGRLLVEGEPSVCTLSATRGLGIGLSGLSLRLASCGQDGVFELSNLEPGLWTLEITAAGVKKSVGPLQVTGREELGDLELFEGSLVHGQVLDERTGDPVEGVAVAAVGVSEGRPTGASGGRSGADGRYEIRGLEPGRVEVFLPSSPLQRQTGQLVEELEIDLDYSAPGDVSTQRSQNGLRITGLGEDAPEGLEVGDEVEAVTLFGVDPAGFAPELQDMLLEPLLRAAGLPGVTVIVDREGELVELD